MIRQSGILLHITSLPSRFGIGTLGKEAYRFIDFLYESGQTLWQILPIGPTGYGNSPYQSLSTFAGNPYMIDIEQLVNEGLLEISEVIEASSHSISEHVDFEYISRTRLPLLMKAAKRGYGQYGQEEISFYEDNKDWLPDYALFQAIRNHTGSCAFWEWPEDIRAHKPEAVARYQEMYAEDIRCLSFLQFLFDRQWRDMKDYAEEHHVEIIGDIPIYTAQDSADLWSHPELFQLGEDGMPSSVAGVPPDYFSADGQLWGNPLYDWDAMKESGYTWWIRRLDKALERHDYIRIDHFRGFAGYYSIPAGSKTAANGEWKKGPGMELFRALKEHVSLEALIAEDLGILDDPVRALLKTTGLPGMKVLLFGFGGNDSEYLCHHYTENCVAYIGTHDNETFLGWLSNPKTPKADREKAFRYLRLSEKEGYGWGAISTLMGSIASKTVFQMQDILGLDNYARMNTPATTDGNWNWRMREDVLTKALADRLAEYTKTYARCQRFTEEAPSS